MFSHEKLDVYKISLQFSALSHALSKNLLGMNRHARDQLLRVSQSIPLNIAEGNGRRSYADRRHFFQIAYGSALEWAATIDVLVVSDVISASEAEKGKAMLQRVVAMLIRMTASHEGVAEEQDSYGNVPEPE